MAAKCLDLNHLSWYRWPFALSNDARKVWAIVLFLSVIMKFIHVNFFVFFSCHICRATVCWYPEILLPWQRDATTSPLYCPVILWLVEVIILQKRSGERGSNSSVLQRTLDARGKIYNHQTNLDNSYSNASIDVCTSSSHRGQFSPLKYLCNINDKHNCHVEILNANQRFRGK